VTLIQRFGSALNLNIHFHMLVLDGAYLVGTAPRATIPGVTIARKSPVRSSFAVALALFAVPAAASAQTTSWGDPDLQGVWSNQTPIPLERPAALRDKAYYTPEEAAEIEKNALQRVLNNVAAQIPTSGEFNEVWLESGKGKVNRGLHTSLVVDPPDGRIPFTPEGRARWAATPDLTTERITGKALGTDRPEDRSLTERCITSDSLFVPNALYNNYHRIIQAPSYVVIVSENMHDALVVPLDRQPHLDPKIRQWLGDSRGWWEGATLVVETTNFNDKRRFQGSTEDLKLVERFTRVDRDTITYRLTVTDPRTYSTPWTLENILWRSDEQMFESACHEGNSGLANILSGARAAEKR
jgi:hypothetical protein